MKKSTKISIILASLGAVLLIVGTIVSAYEIRTGRWVAFGKQIAKTFNFNINLNNKTENKYSDDIEKVIIDLDSENVIFKESEDECIYVHYNNNKVESTQLNNVLTISRKVGSANDEYNINSVDSGINIDENGVNIGDGESGVKIDENGINIGDGESGIKIDENGINIGDEDSGIRIGENGINISDIFYKDNNEVIIYIPSTYNGEIKCNLSSGDIDMRRITAKDISIDTISGDADMTDILADTLKINTSSGDVEIERVDATSKMEFQTDSGDIDGRVSKSKDAYNIESSTVSGENNLPNKLDNKGVDLIVSTTSGDIEIDFSL